MSADGFAWVAERFGPATETLSRIERTWDAPAAGAVLVEVLAAGVGLPDALMLDGSYPLVRAAPVTPGQEVCGTVLDAPNGSRFSVGDRIIGPTLFYAGAGGFASHTYVTEGPAMLAPPSLSDVEAAGFFVAFKTAHTALVVRGAARAGERLLVLGGSGSSGAAAIVLGRALGLEVTAVASTDDKRSFCRSIGAQATVDRDVDAVRAAVDDHTGGHGFDLVFDPVGGAVASAALATVARYGRFLVVGFASGSWVVADAADMAFRNYTVLGVLAAGFTAEEEAAAARDLTRLVEDDGVRPAIGRVGSMDDVPSVIEALRSGSSPGKYVVTR